MIDHRISHEMSKNSILLPPTDVVIGLERTSYTTQEGGVSAEVCARIQRGMLEREVQVNLQTSDGTAVSKSPPEPHTFLEQL